MVTRGTYLHHHATYFAAPKYLVLNSGLARLVDMAGFNSAVLEERVNCGSVQDIIRIGEAADIRMGLAKSAHIKREFRHEVDLGALKDELRDDTHIVFNNYGGKCMPTDFFRILKHYKLVSLVPERSDPGY